MPTRRGSRRQVPPRRRSLLVPLMGTMVVGMLFGAFLLEPLLQSLAGLLPGGAAALVLPSPLPQEVLVLGTDASGQLTDVMAILHLEGSRVRLVQIPRDTYIESPTYGVTKANGLLAMGGPQAVEDEVSRLVGRPVRHHLLINLATLRQLSDAVGGIEINVPRPLYYNDNSQGLQIDLPAGPQRLSGEQLEGFLRFRHDEEGDLGRMDRQRLAVAALMRRLGQPDLLPRLPALLAATGGKLSTDLNPVQLATLASAVAGRELVPSRIPGHAGYLDGISYWFVGQEPR
jgi:LCP family protein required for cell wall assembly